MTLSFFWDNAAYAEPMVYSGVTTSITQEKSCKERTDKFEIVFVFDEEPKNAASGWLYGKSTSPAEFKRIKQNSYEVIYPSTRYHKLPSSQMELTPNGNGFQAVIRDHIPEGKEVRESICFYEKVEVPLKPATDSVTDVRQRAKDLFSAELLMLEGEDLLGTKKDYLGAEEKGNKALAIMERINGKYSKETLQAAYVIILSLAGQERFEEALEVLSPYRKALPEIQELKEFEELILKAKTDPAAFSMTFLDKGAAHIVSVKELLQTDGYTYVRYIENGEESWFATTMTEEIRVGDTIEFPDSPPMIDFQAKKLNRTFQRIIFTTEWRKMTLPR